MKICKDFKRKVFKFFMIFFVCVWGVANNFYFLQLVLNLLIIIEKARRFYFIFHLTTSI